HLLVTIMDHCIGVEYMSFRATCKSCHLAAPLLQWSNKTALRKLHKYLVVSPWLMVVNKNRGIITFTDPIFGDKNFMKRPNVSIRDDRIRCSRFGWLLFYSDYSILVFFNPFTVDIRKLPPAQYYLDTLCFSTPPTSPDCMVVGFTEGGNGLCVFIHFVAREQSWVMIRFDFGGVTPDRFSFPTFSDRDLYVLGDKGEVYVFKSLFKSKGYSYEKVAGATDCEGECFLVKRDRQFLLVIVGKSREYVEVFKLNISTKEWEKIYCLGRHMIYICGTTCLCIEAEALEMRNKIFFPRLDSKNRNVVFYLLETRVYQRFHGSKNFEQVVGDGRENVFPHAWIEPTWTSDLFRIVYSFLSEPFASFSHLNFVTNINA
ncbi:F-box/kelch-repeat protein At1g57790-like, partial [Bidens hawaiensis]|uniref:F-box/kelch-repeat protein At1g57790-like n=1 Tax=Bidens hawaiensis TaxID=980011 RepID=UPI00404AD3BF